MDNMFDKLKKLNELRNLQNEIKRQRAESVKNGVRVVMDGGFDIVEISLNPELDIRSQERAVREAISDAKNQIQQIIAKNFAGNLF